MGKVFKSLMKVTVAAAAVGGLCYAFKDKIKGSKVYQEYDVDNKIAKVKSTIKEKMPKTFDNEKDYVEDDEIFFDDLDADVAERDYVSIDPDAATDNSEEEKVETEEKADEESSEESTDDAPDAEVPTIEL